MADPLSADLRDALSPAQVQGRWLRPCTWVYLALLGLTLVTFAIGAAGLGGLAVSLSVLGLALGLGASFQDSVVMANAAAGIVVGKVGTAPVSIDELQSALSNGRQPFPSKHRTLDELPALIDDLKRNSKKIVLTNGCFDLLHAGHVQLFASAKELGDFLIIAIDDDASVRRLKGSGRPVIRVEERIRILSALDSVDAVVVFASDEFETLLNAIKPDVLAKGSNYESTQVRGGDLVARLGGRVALVPINEDISSSQIIKTIKDSQ